MKLSIITVCYNSAKTISKTFESVKSQTLKNFEYIVVDGESTDDTKKIIENYKTIITKYVSEKDDGLYDAMNKGIEIATGEFIGILNSDDVFYDNKVLENTVDFLKNNIVEAVIGNIVQINHKNKIVRKYYSKNWNPDKLKIGFMPPHPSIFFNSKLFKKFDNYRLDFVSGADYELIVRFFLKNSIIWKYSNITTTKMLIGGVSSSGFNSYRLISKEIVKALKINNIRHSIFRIQLRGLFKILGVFN